MNLPSRIPRPLFLAPLLLIVLLFSGCDAGIATGLRVGFAAGKPFVTSLVTTGTLSQALADVATQDVDDGIKAAAKAESCENAAKSIESKPARRVAKAKCYFQAAQDIRAILRRHNLDRTPELNRLFTIAAGAVEAFEAYYTAVNTGAEVTGSDGGIIRTGADGLAGEGADKELEKTMKSLKKQLADLSKGH